MTGKILTDQFTFIKTGQMIFKLAMKYLTSCKLQTTGHQIIGQLKISRNWSDKN